MQPNSRVQVIDNLLDSIPLSHPEFSEFAIWQPTFKPHKRLWRLCGYNMRSLEACQGNDRGIYKEERLEIAIILKKYLTRKKMANSASPPASPKPSGN